MQAAKNLIFLIFVLSTLLLSACQQANKVAGGIQVTQQQNLNTETASATDTIYIQDFQLDAQNFHTNQGPTSRLKLGSRLRNQRNDDPIEQSEMIVNEMAEALVAAFRDQNLKAERINPDEVNLPTQGWLVSGIFTEVDEGNRLKRAVIGLGQGSTQMETQVAVSDLASKEATAPFIVFGTIKDTSMMPGAIVSKNPYVAAAKFVLEKNATHKDVQHTAQSIVAEIMKYRDKFVSQKYSR